MLGITRELTLDRPALPQSEAYCSVDPVVSSGVLEGTET